MYRIYAKLTALSFITIISGYSTFAQKSNYENAPYSKYGVGELRNNSGTLLKGMGTISSAYASPFEVNADNPASYSFLKLTTYQAGGEARRRIISGNGEKYTTGTATFSYMNLGIPVAKNAGVSLGLMPYSRTYYKLNDTFNISGFGEGVKSYYGDGTLNYAYLGAAVQQKGISLGFNFGYLFGSTVDRTSVLTTNSGAKVQESEFSRYATIGGIYWKAGLLYQANLKKDLSLRIGATTTLNQSIKIVKDEFWISHSIIVTAADTAYHTVSLRDKLKLPLQYSAGAHLVKSDKWMVGADFSAAQWSQYSNYGKPDSLTDSYKISVGGEYTPNASEMRKYFQRVSYRLGFYYGKDYVHLRGTDLNYYAVTAGLSLPFKRTTDRLHMNLEVGQRGTESSGLLKETFVRFGLGLTLNDKWFVKRKYD